MGREMGRVMGRAMGTLMGTAGIWRGSVPRHHFHDPTTRTYRAKWYLPRLGSLGLNTTRTSLRASVATR